MVLLHLRAPNTPSGNPNRCFVAVADDGHILGAWEEGYSGESAIPQALRAVGGYPLGIQVTASEVKRFLKQGEAVLRETKKNPRRNPPMFSTTDAQEAMQALIDTFGGTLGAQSPSRRKLLLRDLIDLWINEGGGDDEWSAWDAAKELSRRIGGDRNLSSYLDTLAAGARRK